MNHNAVLCEKSTLDDTEQCLLGQFERNHKECVSMDSFCDSIVYYKSSYKDSVEYNFHKYNDPIAPIYIAMNCIPPVCHCKYLYF